MIEIITFDTIVFMVLKQSFLRHHNGFEAYDYFDFWFHILLVQLETTLYLRLAVYKGHLEMSQK